jgi:hypothetical protein
MGLFVIVLHEQDPYDVTLGFILCSKRRAMV